MPAIKESAATQSVFMPMDRTSSTTSLLSQRGRPGQEQLSLDSSASSTALWPMFSSDQVWLEVLVGPSSSRSSPSLPSSPSPSPNNSPGSSVGSSECSDSLDSWRSGATCLLHCSFKQQSQEAFQALPRSKKCPERPAACPAKGPHTELVH